MEKKCTKCGKVKSLDEFGNRKRNKDGKQYNCKTCLKEFYYEYLKHNKINLKLKKQNYYKKNKEKLSIINKEYYLINKKECADRNKKWAQKNKEYLKIKSKEYRDNNIEKLKEKSKKWREDNKQIIQENKKEYYKNNKEKYLLISKKYRENNKEKHKLYQKEYYKNNKKEYSEKQKLYKKERRKIDPIFKLRGCISSNICKALKAQGYTKNTKTFNILKCEYDFFIEFLNGVASNGYTYGVGNLHLDHVIPISLAETEDEAILLSHYSNYQLLSADENIVKGNRYINPTNLKRVLEHHPEPNKIKEIYSRL